MIVRRRRLAGFALGVLASFFAASAFAAGVVQSAKGDVRSGMLDARPSPVSQNQHLDAGSRIYTGKNSQIIIRFDDGQRVVVDQNSEFRIVDFRYAEADSKADRGIFDIVKGALRVVTGAIGQRNPSAFQLRAPQLTIGVRGTDFMVSLVNPAYVSVLQGTIVATNRAGTVVFGPGSLGSIANAGSLAVTVSSSSLPAAASTAFSNLSAAEVGAAAGGAAGTPGGAAPGAAPSAAAGAAGGGGIGTAIGIGAAAAGAAALGGGGGGSSATRH